MLCQLQVYSKVIQLYVYIQPFFFRLFSHIGYYRILSRVPCAVQQVLVGYLFYICSKFPTCEPLSCKLSNMRTCVCMSSHISQFTCLAYIVTCVHPLQVVVLLCILLYNTVQSRVVQYLYFKPRISGSKCKSSSDVAGTATSPCRPAVVLYYCTFQGIVL